MTVPEHVGPVLGVPSPRIDYDPDNPEFGGDKRCVKIAPALAFPCYERPDDWFWSRVSYPWTVAEILLWRDGTVKVVQSMYDEDFLTCDATLHFGAILRYDDWRARVLRKANHPQVLCSDVEGGCG